MMAAAVLLAASCAEAEEEKNVREDQPPGEELVQKTFKCSTGAKQTPTPTGWMRVDFKRMYVEGLKYYTEVCGSGMHRWPGGGKSAYLGKHTASHGCIRMSEDSAKWVYKHVPVRSTVYCY